MSKTLNGCVTEVFEAAQNYTGKHVGLSFLCFLLEAEHGGWDGFPSRDKAAIARFLNDFAHWLRYDTSEYDSVFTGSRYLTLDGQPEGWKNPTAKERADYVFRATPTK